ncbi:hypothetical protein BH09VER1_BH09VER1_12720 [soil metagenome]
MKALEKLPIERLLADGRESSDIEKWPEDPPRNEAVALFPSKGIRTILVPLEVGLRGKALLQAASAWSEQLGARLVFLHVCRALDFVPPLATAAQFDDWNAAIKVEAERKFTAMRAEFEDDPFVRAAEFLVVQGVLDQEIVGVAREVGADLILLTTHGYHGLQHMLYGSKAEAVLRHAPCAVLMLPLAEKAS